MLMRYSEFSEQKKLEEELRRKEVQFRTLVENSPDVILRFDTGMRILFANAIFEEVSGLSRQYCTGRSGPELDMPDGPWHQLEEAAEKAVKERRLVDLELHFTGKCGQRWFWGRLIPETGENGQVETLMLIARDVTERREADAHIRYVSFHDNLTGLYNRAYFTEEIKRLDTRRSLPMSFIIGDANYLKLANDTFSHREGDRLLVSIADILRKCCRNEDVVARYGGDEFAVILPRTDAATAEGICSRIKKTAEACTDLLIVPSISLGSAVKECPDQSVDKVLSIAEERMYADKLAQRSRTRKSVVTSLQNRLSGQWPDYDSHLRRTRWKARVFADALELGKRDRQYLDMLIPLHEIGKAAIPESCIAKSGPLTPYEWKAIRRYPEAGYRIANTFTETAKIADDIYSMAEHFDGNGYPRGLKGESIPLLARLFSIVDTYDLMTHDRPHQEAIAPAAALDRLKEQAGRQFDPSLVDVFVRTVNEASHELDPAKETTMV
jgi:diguanylate cyclase (GGDEF)-like protein/PAS domain S-box-containing protein